MPGRMRGVVEQLAVCPAGKLLCVGHPCPQLQGELVMALRLCGCGRRRDGISCSDRRRERLGHVVGGDPVVREHRRDTDPRSGERRILLKRLRVRAVQSRALARKQILVDRGPGQRVAKRVSAAARVHDQQLVLDNLAQRRVQLVLADADGDLQQSLRRPASRCRCDAQHVLRVLGQQIDARQQHVAQGWRQVIVLDPPVSHGAQQLLDEQRNPLRSLEQQVHELSVGALIEDRLDLGADLLGAESLELEPLDRALLVPSSGHAAKRMRPVQLVVAHCADQQRVTGQSPHEQCDQVERRAVGPLHVLEHEHQRPLGGQPRDESENKLRNSGCTVVGGAHLLAGLELGEQPGDLASCRAQTLSELVDSELGGERAQHLDERSERNPLTSDLDAAADEHARAGLIGPRLSSWTSRDLPTPASPPTRTAVGSPAIARSRAPSSTANSA